MVLFDPHRWLGSIGPGVFHRMMTLTLLLLIMLFVVSLPTILATGRTRCLYPALLAYLLVAIVGIPFAPNPLLARQTTQNILLYYLLATASLVFVRSVHHFLPILLMNVFQYAWWAVHARTAGLIAWHPLYGNPDGFGPLMLIGMGLCFHFGHAVRSRWMKAGAFLLASLGLFGVVASFARGAFLSALVVAVLMWVRAPSKLRTIVVAGLAAVIVMGSAAWLFPEGVFWAEMKSSFTQGTEEGTGRDRWELWNAAVVVFRERPAFGAGAGNFGPYAADRFGYGEVFGYENPRTLYGRNLHSIYFQILSEFGVMGCLTFAWLLVDFWRRNRRLRRADLVERWSAVTGGWLDLRQLSIGLEIAVVAYLCSGFFYAVLYTHWFYTLMIANALLHSVASPLALPVRASRRRRREAWKATSHRYGPAMHLTGTVPQRFGAGVTSDGR